MAEDALNSPVKRRVLEFLRDNSPSTFKEIKDNVRVSTDALKLALNDLEAEGIVTRKRGKIYLTEEGEKLAEKI